MAVHMSNLFDGTSETSSVSANAVVGGALYLTLSHVCTVCQVTACLQSHITHPNITF